MGSSSNILRFGPISIASPAPLYEQVVAAVKREVAAGRLGPGDALPSLRVLSADLLVSLITIKRAYEELERDGVIYSRQGLGAFVTEAGAGRIRGELLVRAGEALRIAVESGRQAGLSDRNLAGMLRTELAAH